MGGARRSIVTCSLALFSVVMHGCGAPGDEHQYTLYRSSVVNDSMRVHVATFNASDGEIYNRDGCEYTRRLYQAQPGIKTRFWCEKGGYRK
jgi:hypothetical protein